jgi:hypothetical protein
LGPVIETFDVAPRWRSGVILARRESVRPAPTIRKKNMPRSISDHALITGLTAVAFAFIAGVLLMGSASQEKSVYSVVSKYVLASDQH